MRPEGSGWRGRVRSAETGLFCDVFQKGFIVLYSKRKKAGLAAVLKAAWEDEVSGTKSRIGKSVVGGWEQNRP